VKETEAPAVSAEPAAAETPVATTSSDEKKKAEKVGRRLSTRIVGLFAAKPKETKSVLFFLLSFSECF
jgi:hypothetical protein